MKEPTREEIKSIERIKWLIDEFCSGSQQEFADRCGINKASVSQYMHGVSYPSNIRSGQIAKAFGVNPVWVMGYSDDMIEHKSNEVPLEKSDEPTGILIDTIMRLNEEHVNQLLDYAKFLYQKEKMTSLSADHVGS